jgi:sodium pump decarboxylase gamma subunit
MFNLAFIPFEHYSFSKAINVVVTGVTVVFLILVILVAIFSIMGRIMAPKKKEKAPKPEVKVETAAKPEVKKVGNDLSVIAAITAALSEYLGNGNFVIKKIRPAKIGKKASSAWGADGKSQNTRPF